MSRRPFSSSRAPVVRPSLQAFGRTSPGEVLMDLLTFDRLLTGPVIHLIYWAGLALIVLGGFTVVGSAVGLALTEPGIMSWVLAFPTLIVGLLALSIAALLWRSFCELYVAVFQIAADLRALRGRMEPRGPSESPGPSDGGDDADILSRI